MTKSQTIVDALLEREFTRTVTLRYHPYLDGDDWKWYWVLFSDQNRRAVASGQADSRAEASTSARLMAREKQVTIDKIDVVKRQPAPSSAPPSTGAAPPVSTPSATVGGE